MYVIGLTDRARGTSWCHRPAKGLFGHACIDDPDTCQNKPPWLNARKIVFKDQTLLAGLYITINSKGEAQKKKFLQGNERVKINFMG